MELEGNKTEAGDLNLNEEAIVETVLQIVNEEVTETDLQIVNEAVAETDTQIAAETVAETGIVTIADTNTNNNTQTDTDNTPWGLIIVVAINFIIVLKSVVSTTFSYYEFHNGRIDILLNEKLVLIALITTTSIVITLCISSIGLLLKKSWGWWINASYFFYGIEQAIFSYYASVNAPPELANAVSQTTKTYNIIFNGFELIASLLIFLYLFRKKIRNLFSINKRPVKTLFIVFGASIGILIANGVINLIIYYNF